jgi:hypothetical protein
MEVVMIDCSIELDLSFYIFQEIFEENVHNLREAINILLVEPEGRDELQKEMEKVSKLLGDDQDED